MYSNGWPSIFSQRFNDFLPEKDRNILLPKLVEVIDIEENLCYIILQITAPLDLHFRIILSDLEADQSLSEKYMQMQSLYQQITNRRISSIRELIEWAAKTLVDWQSPKEGRHLNLDLFIQNINEWKKSLKLWVAELLLRVKQVQEIWIAYKYPLNLDYNGELSLRLGILDLQLQDQSTQLPLIPLSSSSTLPNNNQHNMNGFWHATTIRNSACNTNSFNSIPLEILDDRVIVPNLLSTHSLKQS